MTLPTTDPTSAPTPTTDTEAERLKAEAEKWKALSRKHEDQNKKHAAELEQLRSASDAKQSDMDKVLAKLADMEKKATEAERRAVLTEVAGKTGLSMAKVARLQGQTVDELIADAGEVFDWKAKQDDDKGGKDGGDKGQQTPQANQPPAGRPKPNLTPDPSGTGGQPPESTNPMDLIKSIPR